MRYAVRRERPGPGDTDAPFYGQPGATHDVFDRDGVYLGTVRLPDGLRFQAVLDNTIWGFRRGELDEIWVEAYERVAAGATGLPAGRP